ncbi:MAG: UxaA family hydrolase, partial [Pseudomonadota bacterium]
MRTVRLSEHDNVVTAITPLEGGAEGAVQLIPRGHKMAAEAIPAGAPVRKYAQVIGYAGEDIAAGAHVHTHNLDFRAVDTAYEFATNLRPAAPAGVADSFMGFHRSGGRGVGTRNYIAVLTSVNCSATAARQIARHFTPERMASYPNVDGVVAFVHGTG